MKSCSMWQWPNNSSQRSQLYGGSITTVVFWPQALYCMFAYRLVVKLTAQFAVFETDRVIVFLMCYTSLNFRFLGTRDLMQYRAYFKEGLVQFLLNTDTIPHGQMFILMHTDKVKFCHDTAVSYYCLQKLISALMPWLGLCRKQPVTPWSSLMSLEEVSWLRLCKTILQSAQALQTFKGKAGYLKRKWIFMLAKRGERGDNPVLAGAV